jgi:hypothetical protein
MLKPDGLPDAAAGSVENVMGPLALLSLGNTLIIGRVKDEDEPLTR